MPILVKLISVSSLVLPTNGTMVGTNSSSVSELSKYSKIMHRLIKGLIDVDTDAVSLFDLVSVFFLFPFECIFA